MIVYVISATGKPLMPTRRTGHIERLLNNGKARIISKVPYVVQLKYKTEGITQQLIGGTDPGRTNIGEAVITKGGKVVYKAHVETRNEDVPKLMQERKQHRQASRRGERLRRKRRAKKCGTTKEYPNGRLIPGCEKPVMLKDIINTESRFANRKRPTGWVTPTVRHLIQTHLNMIHKIRKILPVTGWTMEYNRFAFMLMEDGTIRGVDFQNGRLKGYSSKEEYVNDLQGGRCACCNHVIEHYHHIVPRSKGGSDTPENLAGLCLSCHEKVHAGMISLDKLGLKKKYAALSVLNQAMPYIAQGLVDLFGEEHVTFCSGYQTKITRDNIGMEKDHPEDAICIAAYSSGITNIIDAMQAFEVKQFRRHNRAIINNQRERTYYLNGEAVCKNRNKRMDQKKDSLAEYRKKNPDSVKDLTVRKSVRRYNDPCRLFPGTEFMFQGERHIMSGCITGGQYFRAIGDGKTNYPAAKCQIIRHNTGLVYI